MHIHHIYIFYMIMYMYIKCIRRKRKPHTRLHFYICVTITQIRI